MLPAPGGSRNTVTVPSSATTYQYDFQGPEEAAWEAGWTHYLSDPQEELPYVEDGYGVLDGSDHGVVSLRPETFTNSTQQVKTVFYDLDEDGYMWSLAARWTGSDYSNSSGYYCAFYYEDNDDDPILALIKSTNGSWDWLYTEAVAVQGDSWLKCEMNGSTLRVKVWPVGSTEPSTWNLEETDTAFASGRSGILMSADRHVDVLIDDYSLEGVE